MFSYNGFDSGDQQNNWKIACNFFWIWETIGTRRIPGVGGFENVIRVTKEDIRMCE